MTDDINDGRISDMMFRNGGEMMKDAKFTQKNVKSMYYYFANQVFAPEGNLKKLGIWSIDFKDELKTGWGMFTKSKVIPEGDARLNVTFTTESGRSPIELVGEDLILAFVQLQGLKVSAPGQEELKLCELLEDHLDDDIIVNIGFASGKPVTGSMTVAQYISIRYVAGGDAVAAVAHRLMSEMSRGVGSIGLDKVPEKNSFWTRISAFGKKIRSTFVKR